MPFDVVVVGVGAMGSAILFELSRRGLRVLGIDRYAPPHFHGSSHGRTRLIREAYYEDPLYVPLVRRAYDRWHALAREAGGDSLVTRTGSLMIGAPDSELVRGTLRSAEEHAVPHQLLSADRLHQLFPAFAPLDEMVGVHEPGSSLLDPERIIALHLELAARAGAQLGFGERVSDWQLEEGGVQVRTDRGTYLARYIVLAAGAWAASLVPSLALPLEVERQVQCWWEPIRWPELHRIDRMPVSMWELGNGKVFYTMPDTGAGVKIGWHHNGRPVDPDGVDRELSGAEGSAIADLLRRFLPNAKGRRLAHEVCLYTNTPDRHFIVDRHPEDERVLIVSACSGHGFKFASVIGEIVADLLTQGGCAFDLGAFRASRFEGRPARSD
ncbi:MAG: N-methyl-L-tryptophan oxidase [Gemmatimonadaceae bacterium]